MSEKKIKLNAFDDVKDFVTAADKCNYDVDISYNRTIIDGKSLMGVLSMDLNRELTVRYSEEDEPRFAGTLKKYSVDRDRLH